MPPDGSQGAAGDQSSGGSVQQQQQQQQRRLPVTLLSGFLGAGKTTLVKHLLRNAGPLRIAVVVNDVAALNIDASLIKGGGLIQSQEQLVELQNGCICCSLRVDLVAAVAALAAQGAFDLLLLESTGVSEPMQVAEMFEVDVPITDIVNSSSSSEGPAAAAAAASAVSAAAGGGDSAAAAVLLRDVSYLDTAVTVVDAHHMLANLHSIHTFRDLSAVDISSSSSSSSSSGQSGSGGPGGSESVLSGSHRHIAELLLEQVEVADVLLLNKADTVSGEEQNLLQAMLRALNPSAKLFTTTNSVVDPSEVLLTGLWEQHKAQGGAAWVQLMRQDTQTQQPQQQQQHDHAGCGQGSCTHQHSHPHGDAAAEAAPHSSCSGCPNCPAAAAAAAPPGAGSTAAAAAGGESVGVARPTSSYGVSHFVYRARLPFHPVRLHDFMVKFFILQEPDWSRMMMEDGTHSDTAADGSSSDGEEAPAAVPAAVPAAAAAPGGVSGGVQSVAQLQSVAAERRCALEACFGVVLRSKGFLWVATRSDHIGEWSQAGSLLSFSTGGPWFCVQPPDAWPEAEDDRLAILADFSASVGDRRQELVFIGVGLREQQLRAALDDCLVTVRDMEAGFRGLQDPFEPWPDVEDMMDLGDPDEEEAAQEDQQQQQQQQQQGAADVSQPAEAQSDTVIWRPGHVAALTEGAAELQELLISIEDSLSDTTAAAAAAGGHLVVIEWVAPWASASLTLSQQLQALASACPHLPVVSVDVSSSMANQVLALEKVMQGAQAYRKGGRKFHPVPKSGEKWPCVTPHLAPSLQPQQEFTGTDTLANLLHTLAQLGCISQQAVDTARAAAVAATTPAAVAAISMAATEAAYKGPLRPPPRTAGLYKASAVEPTDEQTAAAAVGPEQQQGSQVGRSAPTQQQHGQQFKLVKRGANDLKQLLQQVDPSQLLLLVWSTPPPPPAASEDEDQPTSSSSSTLIDSADAVESLAASLVAAAAAAHSSSLVVVAVADAAASTANQSLASALSVHQPVVQLYHNRQMVKVVKVGGLEGAAAVGKVQKAVLQVLAQAQVQAQQPKQQQQQQQQQPALLKQQAASSSAPGVPAAAVAAEGGKAGASSSSSASASTPATADSISSASTAAAAAAAAAAVVGADSSGSSSIWDPPAGKGGKPPKPGSKQKLPASAVHGASSSTKPGDTVKAVFWPRMPCLECGCPWWLGEDWDATCARCGWSCEEDGYDDDSNPLPQYAQRYKDIVAELKEGRTPSGLQPLEG